MEDQFQKLANSITSMQGVEVLHGLEGYTKAILLRMQCKEKLVRQIINAEKVRAFHNAPMDEFVSKFIAQRAELGIKMQNLIREEDTVYPIELSNPATLKETRTLPKGFVLDSMLTIFDDFVTLTTLDTENTQTIIFKNEILATTFKSIHAALWTISKEV